MPNKQQALVNGKLLNPIQGTLNTCNLVISKGKLVGMGYVPDEDEEAIEIIDLSGCLIIPLLSTSPTPFSLGAAPSFTVINPSNPEGFCRLTYVDGECVFKS